jgi:hypothetical protein
LAATSCKKLVERNIAPEKIRACVRSTLGFAVPSCPERFLKPNRSSNEKSRDHNLRPRRFLAGVETSWRYT